MTKLTPFSLHCVQFCYIYLAFIFHETLQILLCEYLIDSDLCLPISDLANLIAMSNRHVVVTVERSNEWRQIREGT